MDRRLSLQALLETIVPNVYFQPPANIRLVYPCIIYKRDWGSTKFADNNPYNFTQRYQLTVIDTDPDSAVLKAVKALPACSYLRYFAVDNLNHDILQIYY